MKAELSDENNRVVVRCFRVILMISVFFVAVVQCDKDDDLFKLSASLIRIRKTAERVYSMPIDIDVVTISKKRCV